MWNFDILRYSSDNLKKVEHTYFRLFMTRSFFLRHSFSPIHPAHILTQSSTAPGPYCTALTVHRKQCITTFPIHTYHMLLLQLTKCKDTSSTPRRLLSGKRSFPGIQYLSHMPWTFIQNVSITVVLSYQLTQARKKVMGQAWLAVMREGASMASRGIPVNDWPVPRADL